MTTTNSTVLKIMNVLFWIAFIGLCIETGALLTSFLVSLFISAEAAGDLYMGLNLSELFDYDRLLYLFVVSLLIFLSGMKAYIAYLIVTFFMKFDLAKPFSRSLTNLFLKISYTAMTTGIVALISEGYCKWILKKGIAVPMDWSGGEILFFAGVIYLLALVYQKGTELQMENDLTV